MLTILSKDNNFNGPLLVIVCNHKGRYSKKTETKTVDAVDNNQSANKRAHCLVSFVRQPLTSDNLSFNSLNWPFVTTELFVVNSGGRPLKFCFKGEQLKALILNIFLRSLQLL